MYEQQRVAVIGAGAAGMMAAIYACQNGANVTVFEKNDRVGKKLAITGKGRCNVTNDCDTQELLKNIISNPKFLYAAFSNLDTQDTKAFFEGLGVPLKTERGRRVFPVSDKAMDIVLAYAQAKWCAAFFREADLKAFVCRYGGGRTGCRPLERVLVVIRAGICRRRAG